MKQSFRDSGTEMDPVRPARRLRGYDEEVNKGLAEIHRWRPSDEDRKWSLRENLQRHADSQTTRHKFLWYNTWLLDVEVDRQRVPLGLDKPQIPERARELGARIRENQYDIVCLCEVFDPDEISLIKSTLLPGGEFRYSGGFEYIPPPDAPTVELVRGPKARQQAIPFVGMFRTGSGLVTLGIDRTITRVDRHEFDERGDRRRDADWRASKGVLLTEVDLGVGKIDLYSTHLFAGGDWRLPSGSDHRRSVKRAQVEELAEFVRETHDPRNVAIVTGDFNIEPIDEIRSLPIGLAPSREDTKDRQLDEFLTAALEDVGLRDAWPKRGGNVGATHHPTDPNESRLFERCLFDTSAPSSAQYCNDYAIEVRGDRRTANANNHRRIDRLFVEDPSDAHTFNLDLTRVRRLPFWRGIGDPNAFYINGDSDRPAFLSDHLGLEVTLIASPT